MTTDITTAPSLVTHVPEDAHGLPWRYADGTWNRGFPTEADAWGFAAAVRDGTANGFPDGIDAGDLYVEITTTGSIVLRDHNDDVVFTLPGTFPHVMIRHVAAAYEAGIKVGEPRGRACKEAEIRRVLGL